MDLNELLDRFGKLQRVQRMVAIVLVNLVLLVLFVMLVYQPAAAELDHLRSENETLSVKRSEVQKRAANRDEFEAELAILTADLKQALRELPNSREIPELLKRISSIAKKVGLEIHRFQPLPEGFRDYYAEVPVALEVAGSYHEVAMFFDRLAKLNRIVYIRDIEIKDAEERGGKMILHVSGVAVTFRFLTESELQRSTSQGSGKGKKRGKK